jgi:hypothetical protein
MAFVTGSLYQAGAASVVLADAVALGSNSVISEFFIGCFYLKSRRAPYSSFYVSEALWVSQRSYNAPKSQRTGQIISAAYLANHIDRLLVGRAQAGSSREQWPM